MSTSSYAAPLGSPRFRAFANSIPAAGGSLYVYQAGTTTADSSYPTYADALAGTNANTNPVVLDSQGEATVFLQAGRLYKLLCKDASGNTLWTIDSVNPAAAYPATSPTNDFITPWKLDLNSLTGISTSQFRFNGVDVTGTYTAGRRVRCTNSGDFIFGTVTASSYSGGNTTVTVVMDTEGLNSAVTAVYYGTESYANPAYLDPRSVVSVTKNGDMTGFASATKVTSWTVEFDVRSEWVAGSNQVQVLQPGYYRVTATAEISDTSTSQDVTLSIYVAAAEVKKARQRSAASAGNHTTIVATHIVHVVTPATDVISMYVTGTSNTTVYGTTGTALTVERIP